MTHTSTEQPEAQRLAECLEHRSMSGVKPNDLAASTELRRLHARVQELEAQTAHMADLVVLADYATKKLEASQAQRVPMSVAQYKELHHELFMKLGRKPLTDEMHLVRAVEAYHGITQEKQG